MAQTRTRWTKELEELLAGLVAIYGEDDWIPIAKAMNITPRSVKDHYMKRKYNNGPWTDAEDDALRQWVKDLGHRWCAIAQGLGTNRSRTEVRNRYLRIRKLEQPEQLPYVNDDFFHFEDE
jgi:hypothetical protein